VSSRDDAIGNCSDDHRFQNISSASLFTKKAIGMETLIVKSLSFSLYQREGIYL
jgi:hypothetical protein